MPRLELHDVSLTYPSNPPVRALRGVSLVIEQGELVAIEGPSGGGKSTLLNVLGLLNVPTSGAYLIDDTDAQGGRSRSVAERRSTQFSFIFQSFHLLDRRRVVDSVELALLYRAVPTRERRRAALAALEAVGLLDRWDQPANTLSGGERQRVAIARALASGAPVVLADEPTGNLDSENGQAVIDSLHAVHRAGNTVVLVTHDSDVAAQAGRRVHIRDGVCLDDIRTPLPDRGIAHPGAQVPTTRGPDASHTPSGAPPRVRQLASRLRVTDLLGDTVASVRSRPGRMVSLALAVAVGVGLAVATSGLSASASAQVARTFDERENRYVTVAADTPTTEGPEVIGWTSPDQETIAVRLGTLAGVGAAAVVTDYDLHAVTAAQRRPTQTASVYSATVELVRAARLEVDWATDDHTLHSGESLIGRNLAEALDVGPLVASPAILLDGRPVLVAGIIDDGGRMPDLASAIVVPTSDAGYLGAWTHESALVLTQSGAAQQVAEQAPLVIDPVHPEALIVTAPTDPRDLRASIESDLSVTLAVLTGIALLASMIGLTNAMVLAVVERRQEFGLRRAVGARPKHVVALVLGESTVIGAVGGAIGLLVGLTAILTITITQHWAPVFDLRLAPVALAGGILVGALGGLIAAIRASHIQPSEALRQ